MCVPNRYVYDRLTPQGKRPGFLQLLGTQLVSGVWHGLYPGAYWAGWVQVSEGHAMPLLCARTDISSPASPLCVDRHQLTGFVGRCFGCLGRMSAAWVAGLIEALT